MDRPYTLIRSGRKTVAVQVTRELEVIVRAPQRMPGREVDAVVARYAAWIDAHLAKQRQAAQRARPEPTQAEATALQAQARAILPGRVRHFASLMGVVPTGIKITSARTRFGSCSGRDSLCFSWRLMRYPTEAIDYVVVHELAHIVHKNHSAAFYALVEEHMADWRARRAMLRD